MNKAEGDDAMTAESKLPFKDLSDRLMKALHLESRPVGVL